MKKLLYLTILMGTFQISTIFGARKLDVVTVAEEQRAEAEVLAESKEYKHLLPAQFQSKLENKEPVTETPQLEMEESVAEPKELPPLIIEEEAIIEEEPVKEVDEDLVTDELFAIIMNDKLTDEEKANQVALAIEAGANVNKEKSGELPLDIALRGVKHGFVVLPMKLISHYADYSNLKDKSWMLKKFLRRYIEGLDSSPHSQKIKTKLQEFIQFLETYGFTDEQEDSFKVNEPKELKEEKKETAISEDEIILMQAGSTIEEIKAMSLVEKQNLLNALRSSTEEVKTLTPEEEDPELSEALALSLSLK